MADVDAKEGAGMQLTKKQLKALQFRGKPEKQSVIENRKKNSMTAEQKLEKLKKKSRKQCQKGGNKDIRDELEKEQKQ
ncbi:hypothetical protein LPJ57_005012, partial [Coemansia sp. RSA 486]